MMSLDEGSMVIRIVQASNLPFSAFRSKAFVEIIAGDLRRRTESVKQKKGVCTWWDAELAFPYIGCPSKIIFSVLRDGVIHNKCLGMFDSDVEGLLESQRQKADGGIVLPLVDERGNPMGGQLTIRIVKQSVSAVAAAIKQAHVAATSNLPLPLATTNSTSDAVINHANAASNQPVVSSFESLLRMVGILVKAGDRIAQIHPYANFAWQVLSSGLKMVQAQQGRDQHILDLLTTMEDTYSFIVSVDELKKSPVLQDIVEQILKQTIECGYFIQEYARHNFGERAATQPFSGMDDRITAFCDAFNVLRKNFDTGLNLNAALVLSRTTVIANAIRRDQLLSTLKAVEMHEHNRKACLVNTRLDIIKSIIDWIADSESSGGKKVLWLYGLAGSGKSTLSTTIAWMMGDLHRLGAFFFFDRDISERNATTLIRTLAYQLALFNSHIGEKISEIIEHNPRIAERPLDFQFANLLSANALESVEWSGGPIVLVIDALDECSRRKDRQILLQALSKGFSNLPSFMRVVVFSRPETDIEDMLMSHQAVYPYLLDIESVTTQHDISEFLRHRFSDIRRTIRHSQISADWPGTNSISALTKCAAGLFVWASTACLYVDSHHPDRRLHELITHTSVDTSSEPFANLDRLYETGLRSAGRWTDPLFQSDCSDILGAVLCARTPLSCSSIDSLLLLSQPCMQSISRLGCVLRWGEAEGIRILHPSFHDYLSKRCSTHPAEPWSIDLDLHNQKLALHCIKLMDKMLRENICGLTLPLWVQKQTLPEALSYACKFWVEHVCLIPHSEHDIGDQIYSFLSQHLLHWVEASAVLKNHNNTIQSLQILLEWLQKSSPEHTDLHQLVYDGHRFVQYFANTIMEHPLLLYITALSFTPANTSVYKGFYHGGLPEVVCGVKSWPRQLQQLQGHDNGVYSAAFSYDGTKIVSGSEDKTIRVWNANTGVEMLPPLQGHNGHVRSVVFSPDGSKIASGSEDNTIRIWDACTGVEMLPPMQGHNNSIYSVAFSPDGSKLISGSGDKTIRVWNASSGVEMLPPLQGHDHYVSSVTFSPNGSTIGSGSWDHTIRIWDANIGVQILPPLRGHEDCIGSIAFSPDGSKIVSGSLDKTVRIWNANTGVMMSLQLQGHSNAVDSVAFSSDGSKIVSGSWDKTIRVWDASSGIEVLPPLQGHRKNICSVGFSPDGSRIVSGSLDNTVRVWEASCRVEMQTSLQGHHDHVCCVEFSLDGSKIVSGSLDKTIRVWNAKTGFEMLPPLEGHSGSVESVAFSPDGSKIVSGSLDKTIRVWDVSTGIEIFPPLQDHNDSFTCVAFSTDGSKVVSKSVDGIIQVWDITTGSKILPTPSVQTVAEQMPVSSSMDCRIVSLHKGWFTHSVTGHCLGRLPVEVPYYGWQALRSGYVGWTLKHKLVILRFPVNSDQFSYSDHKN